MGIEPEHEPFLTRTLPQQKTISEGVPGNFVSAGTMPERKAALLLMANDMTTIVLRIPTSPLHSKNTSDQHKG